MPTTDSIALAGGAITAGLIEVLIRKGVLTADEAATIGARALNLLTPYAASRDAAEASKMIAEMLVGPRKSDT